LNGKFSRTVLAALSAALLATGCSKVVNQRTAAGRNPWTIPGVFRFTEFADPKSLDPVLDAAAPTLDLSMFIFSYAVRYNAKAQPVPDALSEIPTIANGDVSKDGLTLRYKLRHGIRWQDGAPLTCNDLKFTWQVVMNPHNDVVTTDGYKDIKSIDCSNPYVAVVHMKRVYAPFLQQLWGVNGNAPILPEHLLAKYNDAKGSFNTAPYNSMPIGSGPFKVIEWQRGQDVRMEANPYFYLGKPKLNEVVYKILPDENTAFTQLQTHEIDMLAVGSSMKWPQYKALAENPRNGLVAIRVDGLDWDTIDFNLQHPIVGDVYVRRAIAYATNEREIIDKLLHGSAIPADTPEHPLYSWAYTNDTVHYPYDPAKARAILAADGWQVGPDGIRVKNGQRLEITLSTQTESTFGKTLEPLLQRMWRAVGIQADVKNYPSDQFFENSSSGVMQGGHFDVATHGWFGAPDPDLSALYSADNMAPRGQNDMHWDNPIATKALNDALATVDQARRKRDYVIFQQQLLLDVPVIVQFFRRDPYVYNSDLKGFDPSPVISAFWDPWNYSI
jgi:peptide/nickel transport system substrate-binding protein